MKGATLNTGAEGCRIHEIEEDHRVSNIQKSVSRRMTQRRRSVEIKESDLQLSGKMAEVSSTHQIKNITDATLAEDTSKDAQGATRGKKLKIPNMKLHHSFKPDVFFTRLVIDMIEKLNRVTWFEDDALALCIRIRYEVNKLKKNRVINRDNQHYLNLKIGSIYENVLGFALDYLKHKADAECSWEYCHELNILALCFYVQPKDTPIKLANRDALKNLYRQCIQNELNYLDYWKYQIESNSTHHSFNLLKVLLKGSHVSYFLKAAEIDIFIDKQRLLNIAINHSNICGVKVIKYRRFYCLEEKVISNTANMKVKRKYYDQLHYELLQKTKKVNLLHLPVSMYVDVLSILKNIYNKCVIYLPEFQVSIYNVKVLVISLSKKIMLKKSEGIADLEADCLNIIHSLIQQDVLDEECKRLYESCTMSKEAGQTENWTYSMYFQCMDEIFNTMNSDAHNCALTAASMLKDLLDNRKDGITKLDRKGALKKSIKKAETQLYMSIFMNVIMVYDKYKMSNISTDFLVAKMEELKDKVIQYSPYTFLLNSHSHYLWKNIACLAFCSDINKMSTNYSFSESNTELLLHLKHIAPCIPNVYVRSCMECLFIQYFKMRLEDNTDAAHTNVDNELSEWVEYLSALKDIRLKPEVIEIHAKWKMNTMNNSRAEPKDESITSSFSYGLEQPLSAEKGASVMVALSLFCADQQAMDQREPLLTDPQPLIPTNVQQYLQAPGGNDDAPLASFIGEGYPFFPTPLPMLPPLQYPRLRVYQSALTSETVELPSWSFQPTEPPPRFSGENPLCSGILQIICMNRHVSMKMSQLQPEGGRATPVPAQNRGLPLNPEAPIFEPRQQD